jgi:hypothetical protein
MKRQSYKKILFIFLLLSFTCPGIKAGFTDPAVKITGASTGETISYPAQHIPGSALKDLHIAAANHIVVQKNPGQLYFSPSINFYKQIPLQDQQLKESRFLIKSYLACIYPSHNFW